MSRNGSGLGLNEARGLEHRLGSRGSGVSFIDMRQHQGGGGSGGRSRSAALAGIERLNSGGSEQRMYRSQRSDGARNNPHSPEPRGSFLSLQYPPAAPHCSRHTAVRRTGIAPAAPHLSAMCPLHTCCREDWNAAVWAWRLASEVCVPMTCFPTESHVGTSRRLQWT